MAVGFKPFAVAGARGRRVVLVPRYRRPAHARRGMGDFNQQVNQGAQLAQAGAATTAAMLVQFGVIGGPAGAAIGAAAAALILVGSLIAKQFQGCGQTCIIASQDANKYGDLLLQNLRAYLAAPIHYRSFQLAALNNFDTLWNALQSVCSDPSLGDAGRRCLSDRAQGACKWKSSHGGWVSDGAGGWKFQDFGPAGSGDECWNYFIGMRDPIANDPTVVPDPSPITTAGNGLLSSLGINPSSTINGRPISDLYLPVGLLLAAAVLS